MAGSDTIARHAVDPDGLDFASLRGESIASAQELAGKVWTDYNLHDPGVTIIEQLCFALTELGYKAGIPVADVIADHRGLIDYHRYGLLKPHEIFPSGPVTPEDYCKLLIDAVPEIERVVFTPLAGFRYAALIKLLEPLTGEVFSAEQRRAVVDRVRDVYAEYRNVGEDLDAVVIEESVPCFLSGTIEATGKVTPAEVHADIFFRCSRRISSNITLERYENVFAAGRQLAEIFTGPLTMHGHIDVVNAGAGSKVLEELNGLVAQIAGVKKIRRLELVDADGNVLNNAALASRSYYIKFPDSSDPVLLVHFNASKSSGADAAEPVSAQGRNKYLEQTRDYLQKLEFEYRAFRRNKLNAGSFYKLPTATPKQLQQYYSVQNQFPNIYGINADGVPAHQSRERKAYARQLKAYLYPVEQVMANFQQMLQDMQQIFSVDPGDFRTAFAQYLDDSEIPGIEELYIGGGVSEADVSNRLNRYYDGDDRKNRALDTLLALYGEEFSQDGLLAFNSYRQEDAGRWTAENKLHYLRNIGELSARRSGAFNIRARYWDTNQQGALHKKLAILLGIGSFERVGSLSSIYKTQNIRWVKDATLARAASSVSFNRVKTTSVPPLEPVQAAALTKWRHDTDKALSMSPALLAQGVNMEVFRLSEDGSDWRVWFHLQQQDTLVLLSTFADRDKAVDYVYKLRKIITGLNVDTEGFYLVEHQLLRTRSEVQPTDAAAGAPEFFEARISFVFPDWTARFANAAFRRFAQKTICNNLPAHVLADFHWVGLADMEAFEALYQPWLDALMMVEKHQDPEQGRTPTLRGLDKASGELSEWLQTRDAIQDRWV